MKCPLLAIANMVVEPQSNVPINDCLKEECAWWEKRLKICSVLKIAMELSFVSESMTYLLAKTPKGGKA